MVHAPDPGFVVTGDGRSALATALAPLAPAWSLVPATARPSRVRRVWLDTFDWRLHRAGFELVLEQVSRRGGSQLTLTGGNEEPLSCQPPPRWPALASALPAGPLRARLAPLTGVRALLPTARAAATITRFRVLRSDDGTVAWVTLEESSLTWPQPAALPPRLTVTAVPGHQRQADDVRLRLARVAGVSVTSPSPLDAALAAAGQQRGGYSGQLPVELTPGMPARAAVAAVLLHLLDTLEANLDGTLRDIDTEFLHDLRVSVRRTRTALKLTGDVLPDGLAARFRPEFKWLGDATTPTRDLDVYLLACPALAESLAAADPADLAPFQAHLASRRAAEWRRLARALRSPRFTSLTSTWRAELTALPPGPPRPGAALFAARRIRRAHRRVIHRGAAITADSPPELLHDLRKRCKELRYTLEFFASLHAPATHRKAVTRLKGLQDCLGELQDCQVQLAEIRQAAAHMAAGPGNPAAALLAMGELTAGLASRERHARGEFAGRFADFASPASQRRFRALTSEDPP